MIVDYIDSSLDRKLRSLLEKLPEPSKSLVWLLLLTGLRIGELLALRWQDVDLDAGLLRVRRTLYEGHFDEPKTRSSARTVPLSSRGLLILSRFKTGLEAPETLVFRTSQGTPLCRRNLRNRQLDPVCEELKIPKIGWHTLRHSNATLLDAVGTPLGTVQSLLGHSSPDSRLCRGESACLRMCTHGRTLCGRRDYGCA